MYGPPSGNSQAGPSRLPSRPAPTRTLRQPHALNVAQRDTFGVLSSDSASMQGDGSGDEVGVVGEAVTDAQAYRDAMARKVELRRKGDKWVDRMCEGIVSEADFRKGARYLESHHFSALTHERHLTLLCSYPLCANGSRRKWKSTQRVRVTVRTGSVEQVEGNAWDGYCSRLCEARGAHVGKQLELGVQARGKGWRLELLDDVAERMALSLSLSSSVGDGARSGNGLEPGSGPGPRSGSRQRANEGLKSDKDHGRKRDGEVRVEDLKGDVHVGDMQIRERPTDFRPVPPALQGSSNKKDVASQGQGSDQSKIGKGSSGGVPADVSSHPPTSPAGAGSTRPFDASAPSPSPSRDVSTAATPATNPGSGSAVTARPKLAPQPAASRRDYSLASPVGAGLTTEILAASRLGTIGARVAQAEQSGGPTLEAGLVGAGVTDDQSLYGQELGGGMNGGGGSAAPGPGQGQKQKQGQGNNDDEDDRMPQWAKDLSFGPEDETDEVRDLFEQMRMGMEIMRAEEEEGEEEEEER